MKQVQEGNGNETGPGGSRAVTYAETSSVGLMNSTWETGL